MKKEILKYEKLSEDIEYLYSAHFNRMHFLILTPVLFPLLFFAACIDCAHSAIRGIISMLLILALASIPFLITILRAQKTKSAIKKNGYTVVRGKLLSINSHDRPEFPTKMFDKLWLTFVFSVGEWTVGAHHNFSYRFNTGEKHLYRWSKEMSMTFEGLYNTSLSGDEFYIVVDTVTHNLLYAYNTKFFTLENEE